MDTYIAKTPVDLLALVPLVIGFHPEDSIVLLTFADRGGDRARTGSSFHARVDLPVTPDAQREVVRMLERVCVRHGVGAAAVVLYTDDAEAAASLFGLLVPSLVESGIDVIDVLRVEEQRYFAVPDPDDEGTPFELGAHPLTASGVVQGRVVMASRAALADSLVGTDTTDLQAVAAAADAVIERVLMEGLGDSGLTEFFGEEARWLLARLDELADRSRLPGIEVEEAARILVLLSFDSVREAAWTKLHRTNAADFVQVLRELVRRAPDELRPGVSGLLALAAWLAGDGALAWCAIDRCFGADPDDSLAQHVAALLEAATPPSVWAPMPAESLPLLSVGSGRVAGPSPSSPLGSVHGPGRGPAGVQPR